MYRLLQQQPGVHSYQYGVWLSYLLDFHQVTATLIFATADRGPNIKHAVYRQVLRDRGSIRRLLRKQGLTLFVRELDFGLIAHRVGGQLPHTGPGGHPVFTRDPPERSGWSAVASDWVSACRRSVCPRSTAGHGRPAEKKNTHEHRDLNASGRRR